MTIKKRLITVLSTIVLACSVFTTTASAYTDHVTEKSYLVKNGVATQAYAIPDLDADNCFFRDDVTAELSCNKNVRMYLKVRIHYVDEDTGLEKEEVKNLHITKPTQYAKLFLEVNSNDAIWARGYFVCNSETYGYYEKTFKVYY